MLLKGELLILILKIKKCHSHDSTMRGEEIFKDFNIIEVKFPETSEYNWLGRTSIYSQPKKASVRRRTPRRYTKKVVTNCDAACCKNRMER